MLEECLAYNFLFKNLSKWDIVIQNGKLGIITVDNNIVFDLLGEMFTSNKQIKSFCSINNIDVHMVFGVSLGNSNHIVNADIVDLGDEKGFSWFIILIPKNKIEDDISKDEIEIEIETLEESEISDNDKRSILERKEKQSVIKDLSDVKRISLEDI